MAPKTPKIELTPKQSALADYIKTHKRSSPTTIGVELFGFSKGQSSARMHGKLKRLVELGVIVADRTNPRRPVYNVVKGVRW